MNIDDIKVGQRWLMLEERQGELYDEIEIVARHADYVKIRFVETQVVSWRHALLMIKNLIITLPLAREPAPEPGDAAFDYASGIVPGAARDLIDRYKYHVEANSIAACRFCGTGVTQNVPTEAGVYIECIGCGARGPFARKRYGEAEYGVKVRALELWNKQPPIP